ncbi:hypothetical protein BCR32DRAFT_242231 [Anaeromyces robustus]|uniref:Uncharacterized protein n=1 Tax=Anaeromyces robustus TaxID=1754192 RepID=A0A1Y1XGK9_9FUNG|nr:hypothetical protein BCR32DRAFT_242231 [Anaeromyces robustus]|eukprot:ORX84890.1 hypothetical protein BCR32DRAFT_242231 [Anaeromyces robustus]
MNKHFLIYTILFFLINYFINSNAENSDYIIVILRKETDRNYDKESKTIQKEMDKLVNDRMNDIYEIIIDYKESYTLENGLIDEKLNELNSLPIKKSNNNNNNNNNNKIKKYLFVNEIRPNYHILQTSKFPHSSLITENSNNKNLESSTIEYIPFKSNLVRHLCPISNTIAIVVYLSDVTKEIVCNLKNILYCEKDQVLKEEDIYMEEEIEDDNDRYLIVEEEEE